jgi:hypothetical protein
MRRTVEILLNLIEQQQLEIKELQEENQKLRDGNRHRQVDSLVATTRKLSISFFEYIRDALGNHLRWYRISLIGNIPSLGSIRRNLRLIRLVGRGSQNNSLPRNIDGIQ